MHLTSRSIFSACMGKIELAGGFSWRFVENLATEGDKMNLQVFTVWLLPAVCLLCPGEIDTSTYRPVEELLATRMKSDEYYRAPGAPDDSDVNIETEESEESSDEEASDGEGGERAGDDGEGAEEHTEKKKKVKINPKARQTIEQLDIHTHELLRRYHSQGAAMEAMQGTQALLSACVRGLRSDAYGFAWRVYDGPPIDGEHAV